MDVEDAVGKPLDESRGEDAHESGEDHPFGTTRLDDSGHGVAEVLPLAATRPGDHPGGDPGTVGASQSGRLLVVRDDQDDVGADRRCVDERLEIGAGSGGENCDVDERPPWATAGGSVGTGIGTGYRPGPI